MFPYKTNSFDNWFRHFLTVWMSFWWMNALFGTCSLGSVCLYIFEQSNRAWISTKTVSYVVSISHLQCYYCCVSCLISLRATSGVGTDGNACISNIVRIRINCNKPRLQVLAYLATGFHSFCVHKHSPQIP